MVLRAARFENCRVEPYERKDTPWDTCMLALSLIPRYSFSERIIRDSLTRDLNAIQGPCTKRFVVDLIRCLAQTTRRLMSGGPSMSHDSLQKLILPVMTRVFFGLSLSRDSSFLRRFERYILAMGVGTLVIGQLPKFFKRLLVPIFNLPLRYYRRVTFESANPRSGAPAFRRQYWKPRGELHLAVCQNLGEIGDPGICQESTRTF